MNKQNKDSQEAILHARKELNFEEVKKEIIDILNESKQIVLSTSLNDRVTSRVMDFANDDLIIYFMSWDHNKKIKQITGNPQVALCLNNIQIEAKAEILGRLNEEKNSCFLDFHRRKFSEVYVKTFTNIPSIVLVRLTPIVITKFDNIDNRFHFTKLDIK
ncbi:MAG: hypothetical protein FK734_15905, partial [Asgard group archaeon]|nr:hypothetical protein [Asgard group archaeon]